VWQRHETDPHRGLRLSSGEDDEEAARHPAAV
jgi:hypothetical protein